MWTKVINTFTPNYLTIQDDVKKDLHFYITGNDSIIVNEVANALEELLNYNKKSKFLQKDILLDELVILKNGIKIGVSGTIKKIKRNNIDEYLNEERSNLLKETIKRF